MQSSLGQRLRLVVQVAARADEQIDAGCFKVNPYTVASDGLPQLTNAQVVLERSNGQPRLLVTSLRPINDPILRISIEVGCETALRRDLTLLLDPPPVIDNVPEASAAASAGAAATRPATAAGDTATSSPSSASETGVAPATSGAPGTSSPAANGGTSSAASGSAAGSAAQDAAPSAARAGDAAARRAAPPRDVPPRAARPAARTAPPVPPDAAPAGSTARAPSAAAVAKAAPRDRLTISAPTQQQEAQSAPLTPRLTLATTLSERPKQPLPESVLGMLRQKQARLRAAPAGEDIPSLEAELVVLQRRTAELRSQLDSAMAQMQVLAGKQMQGDASSAPKAAAAAPVSEPAAAALTPVPDAQVAGKGWFDSRTLVVAGLTLLIAMLVAGLVTWVRHERADRRRADRWNASPYVPVTRMSTVLPIPAVRPVSTAPPPTADHDSQPVANEQTTPNKERTPPPESYAFTSFSTPHAANQLGVSDLAQATEKASVFVTLGRPEQAIDVLRDHIDHEPKPSPMAWLMLVDLYRKTNRREEFDDVAERFHKLFNVETPPWEQQAGRIDEGLSAYPRLVGLIRKGWPHAEALGYIENLLYDNRGGARIGFSLPAFRDLLLLHGILEEHLIEAASRRSRAGGDDSPDVPAPPAHLAKVWASAPVPFVEPPPLALELDPSLLSDSPDSSALEKGLPVVADAIVHRWGKPGAADYLTNLIALSKDDQNSDVSSEMMGELLLLQDIACVLEESRARDLSF